MSNSHIELSIVVIDGQRLNVSAVETTFVDLYISTKIDRDELLKRRTALIRDAENKGIQVLYTYGTLDCIKTASEKYDEAYENYQMLFELLSSLWRSKVKKGIHTRYSDDKDLQAMAEVTHKMRGLWHRDQPLSLMREVYGHINLLDRRIHTDTLTMIPL